MIDGNAAASSIESDDFLESRLNEASMEESSQLLDEFLRAVYLAKPEIAIVDTPSSALPDLSKVTIKDHMAE